MGLLDELGYTVKPANGLQRIMQKVASSRPGAWLFQRTMYALDKPLFRLSRGRVTLPGLLAGLPVIMLTTTGAKSGLARTMPLLGIPLDGDIAVIGSNYGQTATPGWVYNLEADSKAVVAHGDRSLDVTARRADDEQSDVAFAEATKVYPGYGKYRSRAEHRTIRVFVLQAGS
jgi:deazaflavin-dependent oxidoreductase (nitroreductase family)